MVKNIDNSKEFEQYITNLSADMFSFGYNIGVFAFNCAKFSLKATTSLAYAIASLNNDDPDQTKNYEHAKDYAAQSAADLYTSGKHAIYAILDAGYIAKDTIQLVSEISAIGYNAFPDNKTVSSFFSGLYNQYLGHVDNTTNIDSWSPDLAAELAFADQNEYDM